MYSVSGKMLSLRDLSAGSTFGELSAIDGLPRSADVEALEDTAIEVLDPQAFLHRLRTDSDFLTMILGQMALTIRSLSDRLFSLSTLGVQIRVRAEILRIAREAGVHGNQSVISPAPKHVDIAGRIGVNREQATKELSSMSRQGLLLREGRALVVPDVQRLEKIVAEGSG